MEEKQLNEETLNKIYRNAHIALQSISDIMPELEESPIKTELASEYDGYEKIIGEIATAMAEVGAKPKEIGMMKKTMMWSAIKLKTFADDSQNHIADMMIQGTIMGITELLTLLSENEKKLTESTLALVNKLLEFEENNEKTLKSFL